MLSFSPLQTFLRSLFTSQFFFCSAQPQWRYLGKSPFNPGCWICRGAWSAWRGSLFRESSPLDVLKSKPGRVEGKERGEKREKPWNCEAGRGRKFGILAFIGDLCFVSQPSSPSRAIRHYSKAFTDRHTFGAAFSEEMSIEKKKS